MADLPVVPAAEFGGGHALIDWPAVELSATATPEKERCYDVVRIQDRRVRCGQRRRHKGVHSANLDGEGAHAVIQWQWNVDEVNF